ncbi:hypothetical protein [Alteromonas hispanica]|uniref:hypothetical protein n=1 Tax=Alteromonas hispanica TaxID=315421 RepID=UPI001941F034|nr:hypothetical protein [Alteromonas hispanica]
MRTGVIKEYSCELKRQLSASLNNGGSDIGTLPQIVMAFVIQRKDQRSRLAYKPTQ